MLPPSRLSSISEKLIRRRNAILRFRSILETSLLRTRKDGPNPEVPDGEDDLSRIPTPVPTRLEIREKEDIDAIDQALERIRSGRYGTCEACKGDIDMERLETLPTTNLCARCAIRMKGKTGRKSAKPLPWAYPRDNEPEKIFY